MRKTLIATALTGLLLATSGIAAETADAKATPKVSKDDVSYILGYMFGTRMKSSELQLNYKQFETGLTSAMKGDKPRFDQKEMRAKFMQFQTQARAQMMAKLKTEGSANLKKSKAFLDNNKAKTGIVTLDSGIQYKVITKGQGESPTLKDKVKVEYKGSLMNGEVFDESQKGKPIALALRNTIKGWQQVMPKMKAGGVWEIYIPPALAYGSRGIPGKIGPNEVLIFKVNLVGVEKGKTNSNALKKLIR